MARPRDAAEGERRADSFREATTLCARLRARGDGDSLEAATMVEGTLEAFEKLVDELEVTREARDRARSNHQGLLRMWARVPVEVRTRAGHAAWGKPCA